MYNNCDMHIKGVFSKVLTCVLVLLSVCMGFVGVSCNSGRQSDDERWVDSVLQVYDSSVVDTIVYQFAEEEPGKTVDENFDDFLFAFFHNKKFQSERVAFPLQVSDKFKADSTPIPNIHDLRKQMTGMDNDYFVLLLEDIRELESDPSTNVKQASMQLIDLLSDEVNSLCCTRDEGIWKVHSLVKQSLSSFEHADFMQFYRRFANDSSYQIAHVSHPLSISIQDEECEGEVIEGTIDADQYPVFSPELPSGQFLLVMYGKCPKESGRKGSDSPRESGTPKCVMVKCGMGNGMMDILTFEKEHEEWKLTAIEN